MAEARLRDRLDGLSEDQLIRFGRVADRMRAGHAFAIAADLFEVADTPLHELLRRTLQQGARSPPLSPRSRGNQAPLSLVG